MNPIPKWAIAGVLEETRHCPRRQVGSSEWEWFPLFRHYQAGHLYCAGGIRDQPAVYLRVMRLIESVVNSSRDPL